MQETETMIKLLNEFEAATIHYESALEAWANASTIESRATLLAERKKAHAEKCAARNKILNAYL